MKSFLSPISEIIDDLSKGKMVVIVDDENRENEGDLIFCGSFVSSDKINFMAKYARGLICLALDKKKFNKLKLKLMTDSNQSKHRTAFTVSIEARKGVTTGISAKDRAHTIKVAVSPKAKPSDLVSPGHIFPLLASDGGVLVRAGHTEAAVDLSGLATSDQHPYGVICEIMNDDGTMARRDDLFKFAEKHSLKIGTIADLIQYRAIKEKSVSKEYEREVNIYDTTFTLSAWRDSIFNDIHLAFVKGSLSKKSVPLVRVQAVNLIHDLLELDEFGSRLSFKDAINKIGKEEEGVLLLIGSSDSPDTIINHLRGTKDKWIPDTRTAGIGSQILNELGLKQIRLLAAPLKYPSLSGFDIDVIGYER